MLVTSWLLLLSLPVLAGGGYIILYQHVFWFFGILELYVLILPSFGMISEATRHVTLKRFVYCFLGVICVVIIGFMVWAYYRHVVGMGVDTKSNPLMEEVVINQPIEDLKKAEVNTTPKIVFTEGTECKCANPCSSPVFCKLGIMLLRDKSGRKRHLIYMICVKKK